jgi:membrane protein
MNIHLKNTFYIIKAASKEWMLKDPFRGSAVIAYYAIFSLPGLLIVIIALAGYFFGKDAVNNHVVAQFSSMMGEDTAMQIQNIIIEASEAKKTAFATVIGIATILFGATGMFAQFQTSLNLVWQIKTEIPKSGLWNFIRIRLFSFGLVISIGFLLIVSLFISAVIAALGTWISSHFSHSILLGLQLANFFLSLFILAVLFALMFKFLPDAKIKWKYVWIGAITTAILFEIGKFGLGFYFGNANPGTGYGAAGSIILIMLWVSYTSMIVFFGAELTKAYSDIYRDSEEPIIIPKKL